MHKAYAMHFSFLINKIYDFSKKIEDNDVKILNKIGEKIMSMPIFKSAHKKINI